MYKSSVMSFTTGTSLGSSLTIGKSSKVTPSKDSTSSAVAFLATASALPLAFALNASGRRGFFSVRTKGLPAMKTTSLLNTKNLFIFVMYLTTSRYFGILLNLSSAIRHWLLPALKASTASLYVATASIPFQRT